MLAAYAYTYTRLQHYEQRPELNDRLNVLWLNSINATKSQTMVTEMESGHYLRVTELVEIYWVVSPVSRMHRPDLISDEYTCNTAMLL